MTVDLTSDKKRTYIAIDLKSFFASVECVERGLDPLTTNLVVADASRIRWVRIWLWQMQAVQRKQFVLQCHHRSKPMGFLEEPDCLR